MRFSRKYLTAHVICIAAGAAAAIADDVLEHVPARSAAVLIIPKPAEFTRQLTTLLQQVTDGAYPARGAEIKLESLLDVPLFEEWWDHGAPLVLILSRLPNNESGLTVGFRRSAANRFNMLGDPGPDGSRVRRLSGRASKHGFGTRVGEFVFMSPHRPTLERILRTAPQDSLAAALSPDQRASISGASIFARARIAPWREAIDRWTSFLSAMTMVARAGPETEGAAASMEWFVSGVKTILAEMETVEIVGRIEPNGITLVHTHRFAPDGSMMTYLSGVKSSPADLWAGQSDRPFMAAIATNWRADGDAELMTSMMDRVFACPSVRKRSTPKQYKELRQCVNDWYRDLHGTNFVMCTPEGQMLPMEIRGIYRFEDSSRAMKQFLDLQKYNNEVVAALLPGGGMVGQPDEKVCGSRSMYEMRFDMSDADPSMINMMESVYGKSPRCQVAALDKQNLAYLFTSSDSGLSEFISQAQQKPLSANADVRRVMSRLPDNPHVVVLIDLARAMSAGISMSPMLMAAGPAVKPTPTTANDKPSMMGWALSASKSGLTGQLYASTEDARRFIKATERFRNDVTAPPQAATRSVTEIKP